MRFFHVETFLAPVFLGLGLQMITPDTSYIWISVSVALGCVAFAVQNEVRNLDTLTGLFNRAYLEYIIATNMAKEQENFSGIMLDINDFKYINDKLGHKAGDEALIDTADVLESVIHNDGVVIRYAGDEFIILLPTSDQTVVNETMSRINKAFDENNARQDRFHITFSYGFSSFDPKNDTIDVFLNCIDAAMYENKRAYHKAKCSS